MPNVEKNDEAAKRNRSPSWLTPVGSFNGKYLAPLSSNDWRTSLVPAPAVIPAPIAYIKFVAVKKLVVGFL